MYRTELQQRDWGL